MEYVELEEIHEVIDCFTYRYDTEDGKVTIVSDEVHYRFVFRDHTFYIVRMFEKGKEVFTITEPLSGMNIKLIKAKPLQATKGLTPIEAKQMVNKMQTIISKEEWDEKFNRSMVQGQISFRQAANFLIYGLQTVNI